MAQSGNSSPRSNGRGGLPGRIAPPALAFAAYVALGVLDPRVLLNAQAGIAFAVLTIWGAPAAIRRLRSGRRSSRQRFGRLFGERGQP
jgi:hypothetical protein